MSISYALVDCHTRVYPRAQYRGAQNFILDAARNETLSFQIALRSNRREPVPVRVIADGPADIQVRVRRVGLVPVHHLNTKTPLDEVDGIEHIPGFVPDPLFDEDTTRLPYKETAAFWITVRTTSKCRSGNRQIKIRVEHESKTIKKLVATIRVHPVTINARQDFPFFQWSYSDAILDWYGFKAFDAPFWKMQEVYMKNMTSHFQDAIMVPMLTPSLDGVKRPTQLLKVQKDKKNYTFDWADVRRYVRMAKKAGFKYFEWPPFFTQWGVENAIRVYQGQGEDERLLWKPETGATSPTYKNFLAQLMPAFKKFLQREGILDQSFFHISDEPDGKEHLNNYKKARAMLQEVAPWVKTMDAVSEIAYGRDKITDMPISRITVAKQFGEENIPRMTYFCSNPREKYLNRLMDTPLIKIRMAGWLFYRFQVNGFLHWGYNYWYKSKTRTLIDPYTETSGQQWPSWAYGDTFMVYPGEKGPVDSIRWEIFSQSMQDYALLQSLNIDPNDHLLSSLKDFNDFPKRLTWFKKARTTLLSAEKTS